MYWTKSFIHVSWSPWSRFRVLCNLFNDFGFQVLDCVVNGEFQWCWSDDYVLIPNHRILWTVQFKMEKFNISESSQSNETFSESIIPPILQGSFGIFGNLFALFLLFYHSNIHRWGPFYKFICALAITDFLGLLFHYPVAITRYASNFKFEFPLEFCYFDTFLFSFSFLSSAMIVCAMSCDRFFAVKYPLIYRSASHKTKRLLTAIWIFSAVVASFPLLGFGSVEMYYPRTWCFINFASRRRLDRINTYFYSSLCLLVLFITVVTNVAVIYAICNLDKSDLILSSEIDRKKRKIDETYIVTLMMSIVILFSVCWVPLVVGILYNLTF